MRANDAADLLGLWSELEGRISDVETATPRQMSHRIVRLRVKKREFRKMLVDLMFQEHAAAVASVLATTKKDNGGR